MVFDLNLGHLLSSVARSGGGLLSSDSRLSGPLLSSGARSFCGLVLAVFCAGCSPRDGDCHPITEWTLNALGPLECDMRASDVDDASTCEELLRLNVLACLRVGSD